MVVLIDGVRYRLITPENEAALEQAIRSNYEHIFGPDSFYFDVKRILKSRAGVASIPDGYVIFFDPGSKWCILEVELSSHPIYDHLIPQLTKFNRGIDDSSTRRKLVDILYTRIGEDEVLKARLKQKIGSGEIYKFLSDVISEDPLIIVAIDERTDELEEALRDIRGEVKVLEFKVFQREGVTDPINAYVFEPIARIKEGKPTEELDVVEKIGSGRGKVGQAIYQLFDEKGVENVSYEESEALAKKVMPNTKFNKSHFSWYKTKYKKIKAVLPTYLPKGLKLQNVYKGIEFTAEVIEGGRILFNGNVYASPSGAAVAAIRSTGSARGTEDGWRWWKFKDPQTGEEKVIDSLRRT